MKRLIFCLLLVLTSCVANAPQVASPLYLFSPLYSPASGLVNRTQLYLPHINKAGPCGMPSVAGELAGLFTDDPLQQRVNPVCDPRLVKAAQYRANDMQARSYFSHTDLEGNTPNYWAKQFGCNLPYPTQGNQIESIALNYPTAQTAWNGWKASAGHRVHVLGLNAFFAGQVRYGIGYSNGSYGIIYVLLSSPTC